LQNAYAGAKKDNPPGAQVSGTRMNILILVSKRHTLLYASMPKKYVELSW
jgi:hypothetical protein